MYKKKTNPFSNQGSKYRRLQTVKPCEANLGFWDRFLNNPMTTEQTPFIAEKHEIQVEASEKV